MYKLMLTDDKGFMFCFYKARTKEHFESLIKSLPETVTWEIKYDA